MCVLITFELMAPRSKEKFDLDPMYLNQRRVGMLVGDTILTRALASLPKETSPKLKGIAEATLAKGLLVRWLQAAAPPPPPFEVMVTRDQLAAGRLFSAFRSFYCSGVRKTTGRPVAHATFEGLSAAREKVRLTLEMNRDHVVPGSPGDLLSGRYGPSPGRTDRTSKVV